MRGAKPAAPSSAIDTTAVYPVFSAPMRRCTSNTRAIGFSTPIGSSNGTRPNLLPSSFHRRGSRRFTGTIARNSQPSTGSPRVIRYERIAPATQASSTSLTEQPSALPIALTSSTAIGSFHATILTPEGLPLRLVALSFGIIAIAAVSFTTRAAMPAYPTAASTKAPLVSSIAP